MFKPLAIMVSRNNEDTTLCQIENDTYYRSVEQCQYSSRSICTQIDTVYLSQHFNVFELKPHRFH